MEYQELINILVNAFGKNSKIKNSAIKKIYSFSKKMLNCTNEEKIDKIKPFIESNHIYPKYWGAIIALSYNVLVETSIRELIYILEINPKEYDLPLNRLSLKYGETVDDSLKMGSSEITLLITRRPLR